ncbi:uncharacterized protein LOC112568110 isoform X2 [Pomacea canaliculata]|uniref:uncharacterized protein LOC112568110 isoform X2 n=1 Tax=Pomacea canaliculata TaxID=400727 RepID=UPI000D73450B|nr:uncharacterized protein LOC112568110 isoform X2 [Pomacea canaliculata]
MGPRNVVFLLLLTGWQIIGGVEITPCTDSFVEVSAEENLTLSCAPRTQSMEWRLYTKDTSNLIAKLINSQIVENSFYYAFVASISDEGILLTINTRNIKDIYLLSGAVVCSDLTESTLTYAGCQLNYVYKPKASDVSCTATDDPSGVNLSCTINNTYSSRGIYTCQALRQKDEEHSIVEELNIVDMAGLHYGRGIKFSGRCEMTTKVPQKRGNYTYRVKISPGGLVVPAKLPDGGIWIEHSVRIKPCGEGNITEIKPREKLSLTCTSDTGYVEWTLVAGKGGAQQHLATWENNLITHNDFDKTFVAKTKYVLEINAVNNRKIYDDVSLVNGSLLCKTRRETLTCGLNYVYPAENIVCIAMATSWNVTVSCSISSAYSSRRIYKCQLIRKEKDSGYTYLQTIAMTTSVTNQLIANNEFKVSGNCLLYTQLPAIEGTYDYYVTTSPGGRRQMAVNIADRQSLTVKRPAPPNGSCHPGGHVLENTDVSCVCRTTSLGQPQGSLRWVVGYGTNTVKPTTTSWSNENSPELRYSRTLTMSDHGRTWLRCQLVWGAEELGGDTYMASVAQRPSQPKIACYPSPYVLENTNISCTCNTTSLGLPAGYLTWVTGNYSHKGVESINRGKGWNDKPTTLYYSKTLTLADHGTTWFRCDITWKGQKVLGEIYTANVGSLPRLPKMVCHPAPYVLENTNISCTCSTTSLGKPAGYLTWVTGKYTHGNFNNPLRGDRSDDKRTELHYSQTLTLADHSNTWFRCDVTWGGQKHRGENYTANVGYKPRQLKLFFNKLSENVTVSEGDSVDVNCSADGRPAPEVTLINTVNNTKMATGSSVILSNFSARCEDSGEYTCSSQDYFSSQSPLTTSLRLQVNCKPRSLSPGNVTKVRNMHFDLVAYPMPRNMTILPRTGDAGTSVHPVVSCTADPYLPYKFTCNFTEKTPGYYPVVVTNDFGDGNFTLEVDDSEDTVDSDISNKTERTTALVGGVAALGVVVLAIVFAIIIVAVRSKKSVPLSINVPDVDDDREHLQPPRCCADIGAGVVADKEKQTQDDNKESTAPEEMYANIGSAASDDKAKTQKQKLEGNEIPEKKYPRKPRDLNKDKDKLDKDHVPLTGIERETSATEQVVNTTHHELAEYINTSSAAAAVAADTGRWTNQDGLIYTSADLNSSLSRKRPSPRLQQTEYVEVTFKNGKPHVCD